MITLDLNLDIGLPSSMVALQRTFSDTGLHPLNPELRLPNKTPLVDDDFFIGGVSLRELSAEPLPPQQKR